MNEKASPKICGATGFRLAVVFMADVYVIRRRVFLPRDYDEGRTAAYTRGIPNDFGNFGDRVARHRSPKSRNTAKRSREGAERGSSRAQRFLRLNLLRLAFYLGQTGIRLNALIKLLTSFGRPGGHRVSAGPRVSPFLSRRPFLPFIFVPSLRTAKRNSYLTFDNRCFVQSVTTNDRIVG